MEKKYELTDETLELNGHILHRIKALRSFGNISAGDLGGWIEKEENLSHEGNCWVYQNTKVYNNAVVKDNAKVFGRAVVYDNAVVSDDAKVYGHAEVYCNAIIKDNAEVYGFAKVYGEANICGNSMVFGEALIFGYGWVNENAQVFDNAKVFGFAKVYGEAEVSGEAKVYHDAFVSGNAVVCGDAVIKEDKDYTIFKNTWSSGRYFTWTRSNDKWKVGCFYGTGEELIAKAYADNEVKGKCYEAIVQAQNRISELLK